MTSYATTTMMPAHDKKQFSSERRRRKRRARGHRPWRGWEIALMVVGFAVFWPAGLAILFWILREKRRGADLPIPAWFNRVGAPGRRGGGNSAFEEWKRAELERLEEERRKLAHAESEFAAFLEQLQRAEDREEFDRFMAERAARSRPDSDPPR